MQIHLFTLFPHWFDGPLGESILERARTRGLLSINTVDFRTYAHDKHRSVDDAPYGGGGGMVLRPEPLAEALDEHLGAPGSPGRAHVIYLSPKGRPFDQQRAIELARLPKVALICGHYEAVDQRLLDSRVDEEISLGDFVLTGGEIAAMAVVDAVARMIPGVLGNEASADLDTFMDGLLEAPHYTRPEVFEGRAVPPVLLSGNHGAIAKWREEVALQLTRERRPDLFHQLLFPPDLIRRMARRARPMVIFARKGNDQRALFASRQVEAQAGLLETLAAERGQKGFGSAVCVEANHLRGESEEADREVLRADAEAALAQPGAPRRFLMNLVRAIDELRG